MRGRYTPTYYISVDSSFLNICGQNTSHVVNRVLFCLLLGMYVLVIDLVTQTTKEDILLGGLGSRYSHMLLRSNNPNNPSTTLTPNMVLTLATTTLGLACLGVQISSTSSSLRKFYDKQTSCLETLARPIYH